MIPSGSGTIAPSYRNTLTWSFAASSAQMLPCSTKYGCLVRLMVSTTSGSAAWTSSRTSRQIACCQSGRASMYASTPGSAVNVMVTSTVAGCLLQLLVVDVVDVRVVDRAAAGDGEIVHVVEHEGRNAGRLVRPDVVEVGVAHVAEHERGPGVGLLVPHGHVVEFDAGDVPDEEAVRGQRAEHVVLRVRVFQFGRVLHRVAGREAPHQVLAHVADPDVLDVLPRDARDRRRVSRVGVVHRDVADAHPAQRADLDTGRAAHAGAEPKEQRRLDVAHREVADRDVLQQPAVDGLER